MKIHEIFGHWWWWKKLHLNWILFFYVNIVFRISFFNYLFVFIEFICFFFHKNSSCIHRPSQKKKIWKPNIYVNVRWKKNIYENPGILDTIGHCKQIKTIQVPYGFSQFFSHQTQINKQKLDCKWPTFKNWLKIVYKKTRTTRINGFFYYERKYLFFTSFFCRLKV